MELYQSLKAQLKVKGFDIGDTSEEDELLKYEINRAIQQINRCRRFKQKDDKLYDEKYEDLIIPLAITAFSKIGAEGQVSHSENGIQRTYTGGGDYPKDMLNEIIALIR